MHTRGFFPYTGYIIVASLIFLLSACGSDEAAPSIDTSFIPQTVFFNTTGPTEEYYLFRGRATDNTNVDSVEISIDNGSSWESATIDNDPPNRNWDVEWTYLASSADLSAGMHTVLVRAADRDNNGTTSGPVILESISSTDPLNLVNLFLGASAGDIIGLSTGEGDAFGDSTSVLTIPITADLTVLGSGYGDMMTSGGHSPVGNSIGTVLNTSPAAASLFSVDADLTIRNVRLLGGAHGIHISDSGSADPQLSVEDCLFDRQSEWGVYAHSDGGVNVEFLSSIVDASLADDPSGGGGLYLDNVNYTVLDSDFYGQSAAATGAAIQVVGGAGAIDDNLFEENGLAIWASGTSPTITSCNIYGAAFTTNGINLTNGPSTPLIRRNVIDGNEGYGLRIGTNVTPKVRQNIISNNNLSGILIDFGSSSNIQNIDLGKSDDFGNNDLFGNRYPGLAPHPETVEIFVAANSGNVGLLIPAIKNYWGVPLHTMVPGQIYDGVDVPDRAKVNWGTSSTDIHTFPQN